MNLNAYATPEQLVSRLVNEAAMNASAHLLRLKIITEGGMIPVSSFSGIKRDFVISVMYSLNEQIAILDTLNARILLKAISAHSLDILDYYDAAIKELHTVNIQDTVMQPINEKFEAIMERVSPSPKMSPKQAEQMAAMNAEFSGDDDGLPPLTENGLADLAGENLTEGETDENSDEAEIARNSFQ